MHANLCFADMVYGLWVGYCLLLLLGLHGNFNKNVLNYANHGNVNNNYYSTRINTPRNKQINIAPSRARGKKGGLRHKLRKRGSRPFLPEIIFGNVRCLTNKLDDLRLNVLNVPMYRNAHVIALTETWTQDTPDSILELDNYAMIRADRDANSGKNKGGGLIIYVNTQWCTNITVKQRICTKCVEILSVSLRPFYLPREFSNIFIVLVYIPASDDAATDVITRAISDLTANKPESVCMIIGDFNRCNINEYVNGNANSNRANRYLTSFFQFVTHSTRENAILDLFFCNKPNSYVSKKLPGLGSSDHVMIDMVPHYRRKLKDKVVIHDSKSICKESWDEIEFQLAVTNWEMFFEQCTELEELTDTIAGYLVFVCAQYEVAKSHRLYANNKKWFDRELRAIIRHIHSEVDNVQELKKELRIKIQSKKKAYASKLEHHLSSQNMRMVYKGVKELLEIKSKPSNIVGAQLAGELNDFYTRFDNDDRAAECSVLRDHLSEAQNPCDITTHEVFELFRNLEARKSCGPDKVSPKLLRSCAHILAPVYTVLFNMSLNTGSVPPAWKTGEIIPIPKKSQRLS